MVACYDVEAEGAWAAGAEEELDVLQDDQAVAVYCSGFRLARAGHV